MKKFGTIIIKPDAINKHDMQLILDIIHKNGLDVYSMFEMKDFTKIMGQYRVADVLYKNDTNFAQKEIRDCNVALNAYKELYKDASGILLVLNSNLSNEDFYNQLNIVKRETRNQIEIERGYYFAFITEENDERLVKLSQEKYREIKQNKEISINKAYVNGIHLEDKECFETNFCFEFLESKNVITKENKIENLDEFIDSKSISNFESYEI